jgi:uncharacterized protein YbaP (TraB family)
MNPTKMKILLASLTCFFCSFAVSQKKENTLKYPSVLWEITGNGIKTKAYLFGTMHVSSKLAFNLSDSFYNALNSVDAIALENNPNTWQKDYLESIFNKISKFMYGTGENGENGISNEYITKSSFQINYNDIPLRSALAWDPEVINHFLYRNFGSSGDFEENTYLDMHIFQCAQKLKKQFFSLEDFKESEALMIEGYKAFAGESKRKSRSTEADEDQGNRLQIGLNTIEDAYRKGNLDLMDSLSRKSMNSEGFYEYFLYKRNEIHANEVTKILKKGNTLFAAVGAMHLPGKRGVIELLRAKGYTLRPIIMGIGMSKKRDEINKITIPRKLEKQFAEDSLFTVNAPGKFYSSTYANEGINKQWVHADFSNGAYYMITRVATQGYLWNYNEARMKLKIDSLLYENIPGKIIDKKAISLSGYNGFDILNKTRKGDFQRYNIFITPLEVIVFKMSGFEGYVKGAEATEFFKSISFTKPNANNDLKPFSPSTGGFQVNLPTIPIENNGNTSFERNYFGMMNGSSRKSKGYEAYDTTSKTYFYILPKTFINYNFLEEDTFSLSLCAQSFASNNYFLAPTIKKLGNINGMNYIELSGKCVDDDNYLNRIYNVGTHFYLLISKFKDNQKQAQQFVESFKTIPLHDGDAKEYQDSTLFFSVKSSLVLDSISKVFLEIARLSQRVQNAENKTSISIEDYNETEEKFVFSSDKTNEEIVVTSKAYPKYKYVVDSTKFWQELEEDLNITALNESYQDFAITNKSFSYNNGVRTLNFNLTDTNSTQYLKVKLILNKAMLFTIYTHANTNENLSKSKQDFFDSFKPMHDSATNFDLFMPKGNKFFDDYNSKDSTISKYAKKHINEVKFIEADLPLIKNAINNLDNKSKDYILDKTNLIQEIGYLRKTDDAAFALKEYYDKAGDTATFQNKTILALGNLKTNKAFEILGDILLNDPPVFEDEDNVTTLFENFNDTILLAKNLLPTLLHLSSLDDYKWKVYDLISNMIDSNLITSKEYESLSSKLFFDAKIEQKKLKISDEKLINKGNSRDDESDVDISYSYKYKSYNSNSNLMSYSNLLMPFWDKNPNVASFINKNLQSKTSEVKFFTAKLLEKNKKPFSDSIWSELAEDEKTKISVFRYLKANNKLNLLPKKIILQEDFAKAILTNRRREDSLVYLNKYLPFQTKNKSGWVYFYKYKESEKDVDWKLAFCGLQPADTTKIDIDDTFTQFTNKVLKTNQPIDEQITKLLKEAAYELKRSSSHFFDKSRSYGLDYNYPITK